VQQAFRGADAGDEDVAERVEREHAAEFAARQAEVDAVADGKG